MSALRLALIACDVFEEELASHLPAEPIFVAKILLEMGLHDRPDVLRQRLQHEIDALDAHDSLDAIVLAYALCGRGTHGLRAGRHRLVIPRGHDCITVFLGSKERFACEQAACPDSYYFTPGWMRGGRTPGPRRLEALRAEFSKQFDPEDVEFLLEQERENWAQHSRAVFTDLGTPSAEGKAAEAETTAGELGWKFDRQRGDPSLFRDLLSGKWDVDRFQIVEPGETLTHAADERIFRSQP